jgi:hypothetical protein
MLPLSPENRYLALRVSILGIDTARAAVIWQPERGSGVYVINIYAGDCPLTPDDLVACHNDPTVQPRHSFHFYTGNDRRAFAEADRRIAALAGPPPYPDDPYTGPATVT